MSRKVTVAAKPSTIPPILAKRNSPPYSSRRRNNLRGKALDHPPAGGSRPFHGRHRQRTAIVARTEAQPASSRPATSFRARQGALLLFPPGRGLYFRRGRTAHCLPRDLATSPPPTVAAHRLELCPPGAGRCLRTLFLAHLVPRTPLKQRPRRDHLARNHWQQRPHNLHCLSGRFRGFDRCRLGLPGNLSRTNLPQPLLRSCRLHPHRTFA